MFGMIEMLGQPAPGANTTERNIVNKTRIKSYEELIIEKGALTIFKALAKNCSSAIYKVKRGRRAVFFSNFHSPFLF